MINTATHTPFKSLLIDLLAKAEHPAARISGDDYLHSDIEWHQYPITHGEAGFTSLKLQGGITLHRSTVTLYACDRHDGFIDYCKARVDFTEPVLQVNCTLTGTATRKDLLIGRDHVLDEHNVYVCVGDQAEFITAVRQNESTESVHLAISLSTLTELLGQDAATQLFDAVAQSDRRVFDLGRAVISPLRFCLDSDLPFSVRKLRAYARVLEFISGLAMYYLSHRSGVKSRSEPLNAQTLRQFIRQHYQECVTLEDLARAFGVSSRTIHNILVRETGMPAARMMREQRLALAHELIQQTDLSLTELADRMGYSHLSNFSHAFKKMFGYSPDVLRRTEQAFCSPSLGKFPFPGMPSQARKQ